MNSNTNEKSLVKRILASKCEEIKLGIDQHARNVVVSAQLDGSVPQRAQKMTAEQLLSIVRELRKADLKVHACYEAGPCGFWLARALREAGVNAFVIHPQPLGGAKRQKTDRLDAQALCDMLDRYLRGNKKAFSVVRVPTPEEEQERSRVRLRDQLRDDRKCWADRGRKRMLASGRHVCGEWWRERAWRVLAPELPQEMVEDLEQIRRILEQLDEQEKALRQQVVQAAPQQLPKAIGAFTWMALLREVCTWKRFENRRQVASYTGLCPGVDQSGERRRDGSINRHGNPRVRALLIELVWRLVRWQPDYPPVRKLVEGSARGAARRKLAVAAARRLAIDLWRLATEQTTAANLKLIVPTLP